MKRCKQITRLVDEYQSYFHNAYIKNILFKQSGKDYNNCGPLVITFWDNNLKFIQWKNSLDKEVFVFFNRFGELDEARWKRGGKVFVKHYHKDGSVKDALSPSSMLYVKTYEKGKVFDNIQKKIEEAKSWID